jgi:hypothetical protein
VNASDSAAEHRTKAEACRRLAELSEDLERKAMWIERSVYWDELAAKAATQERQKPSR